jgi:hypothetical protein
MRFAKFVPAMDGSSANGGPFPFPAYGLLFGSQQNGLRQNEYRVQHDRLSVSA